MAHSHTAGGGVVGTTVQPVADIASTVTSVCCSLLDIQCLPSWHALFFKFRSHSETNFFFTGNFTKVMPNAVVE